MKKPAFLRHNCRPQKKVHSLVEQKIFVDNIPSHSGFLQAKPFPTQLIRHQLSGKTRFYRTVERLLYLCGLTYQSVPQFPKIQLQNSYLSLGCINKFKGLKFNDHIGSCKYPNSRIDEIKRGYGKTEAYVTLSCYCIPTLRFHIRLTITKYFILACEIVVQFVC